MNLLQYIFPQAENLVFQFPKSRGRIFLCVSPTFASPIEKPATSALRRKFVGRSSKTQRGMRKQWILSGAANGPIPPQNQPRNEKTDQRSGRRRIEKMVGAAGIEPATFCSQSRRAEPLRYAPKNDNYIKYSLAINDSKAQNNLLQFFINDRPPRKQTATRCNGKIPPDASATENYSSVTSSFFT